MGPRKLRAAGSMGLAFEVSVVDVRRGASFDPGHRDQLKSPYVL